MDLKKEMKLKEKDLSYLKKMGLSYLMCVANTIIIKSNE